MCAANVAIEGVATIEKHPMDPESERFIELYKKHHLGSFKKYSRLESNVVVRVDPTRVIFWKYDDEGGPYREILDVREGRAERESVESCL